MEQVQQRCCMFDLLNVVHSTGPHEISGPAYYEGHQNDGDFSVYQSMGRLSQQLKMHFKKAFFTPKVMLVFTILTL